MHSPVRIRPSRDVFMISGRRRHHQRLKTEANAVIVSRTQLFMHRRVPLRSHGAWLYQTCIATRNGILRESHLKDCGLLHQQTVKKSIGCAFRQFPRWCFSVERDFHVFMLPAIATIISILCYENVHVISPLLCSFRKQKSDKKRGRKSEWEKQQKNQP